ncbi:hypothetical protein FA15DRAFT_663202 [Coprinopsis marcescibilis]|uniref:TEA domain-containing protein n=1 Tax=Coprinopsis marcescibilis TaxID=230819 RepID=A0A5C3LDB1_COPMA|nr:hypothetical protein FA15DRAFT_663202 [Coprinopsis marcescibilis]
MKKQDTPDSITPQRKHRKLLKDGSGVEVWPENIEKTFVQGLREYWQSPYATYSQSRGRSRWRNQFLVDFLQRHGIIRTKKQVASHIQVLRNMWKGQPEFHLVAGGDELVDPVTHIPIKEESDANSTSFDWDDESAHSASPDFSPPDSHSDFPLTPEQRPNLYPVDHSAIAVKQEASPGTLYFHSPTQIASPSTSPFSDFSHALPTDYSPPAAVYKQMPLNGYPYAAPVTSPAPTSYPRYPHNRITTFYLCAEGMTPFSVNVDALSQSSPSPRQTLTLRVKLSVPSLNDVRSPSTLHGFNASVAVGNIWTSSAKCITKVYTGNTLFVEEQENLQVSHINSNGTVHALLPDSHLARCRWLDPNVQTTLTQELVVDDQVLLCLIYDLDRKNWPMPGSELLGFQHYRAPDKASSTAGAPYTTSTTSRRPSQVPSGYPLAPNAYSIPPR